MKAQFTIYHKDHGINDDQLDHIRSEIERETSDGFFILQVEIPATLGTVPCGLHGPAMEDNPIDDSEVTLEARGDREWTDRLCDRPFRRVSYVQVIGSRHGEGIVLYTCYGGPLAPQNPEDPTNEDVEGARAFWAVHALSSEVLGTCSRCECQTLHTEQARNALSRRDNSAYICPACGVAEAMEDLAVR